MAKHKPQRSIRVGFYSDRDLELYEWFVRKARDRKLGWFVKQVLEQYRVKMTNPEGKFKKI